MLIAVIKVKLTPTHSGDITPYPYLPLEGHLGQFSEVGGALVNGCNPKPTRSVILVTEPHSFCILFQVFYFGLGCDGQLALESGKGLQM